MAITDSANTNGAKSAEALREHRQREPQEAVAAHLQKDRREDDGARGRRLDVGVGQPGVHRPHRQLHRERGEEGDPQPRLHLAREGVAQQHRDVGGARLPVHRHDGEQHQHGAGERVEEELEARIDPARAAPHADDEEHRDEAALEEQVEQHEVERREGADHQRFQHQERDHVFADADLDGAPARRDAERHDRGGEDDERQRDAVDAHVVGAEAGEPGVLLDELEFRRARIEAPHQIERDDEGDQRGRERHPAGVAGARFVRAQHGDEQHADERQEGGDGQHGPGRHQCTPLPENMNQVMKAAAPISMAKA